MEGFWNIEPKDHFGPNGRAADAVTGNDWGAPNPYALLPGRFDVLFAVLYDQIVAFEGRKRFPLPLRDPEP